MSVTCAGAQFPNSSDHRFRRKQAKSKAARYPSGLPCMFFSLLKCPLGSHGRVTGQCVHWSFAGWGVGSRLCLQGDEGRRALEGDVG